ncbi:MICOS complex subunit MIC27 [Pungitius pungitius]|uniref:MICOS complex subunit MIC27 n=1 Tax=Pungitius pungitius TaxID=134920 RepID=UPI002E0FE5ED
MAAKVVMLAVPTVMGIASIRVYSVSEVTSDGLVTREKLNIYSPLPQAVQAHFVPERPGVVERGLTTTREGLLPFVQAVKGACVAVKTRSVNIYYAGEDVYYYLKDPPAGFLPRFGTITLGGLLGMFLARKGSHFKRLAVPLGLMSAGASVCYPAQTVAVLKVTGKKVYAAGQWSSAAVSSLLTSTSQEPDIKGTAASRPQMAAVVDEASEPPSGNSAPSSTDPETEVESAGSVPVSESAVAVTTEESVQLLVSYPNLTPTETSTDPVAAETTSEDVCASVESQHPSDIQLVADDFSTDTSPAMPTPSLEPETLNASPVEADTGVDSIQVDFVPVEASPVEEAEVGSSPSTEELPAPKASNEPTVLMQESEASVKPELTEPQPVAAVEETLAPPQQPAPENSKGGSSFTADPALMDFGQSTPEDEDLYSTRS